jgi:preprotein translocase subunit SecF
MTAITSSPGSPERGSEAGLPRRGLFRRLYHGESAFDFVGRKRLWATISLVVIVAGLVSLAVRGLNFGIDFKGGTSWEVQTRTLTVPETDRLLASLGVTQPVVEVLGSGSSRTIDVQANLPKHGRNAKEVAVQDKLAAAAHVSSSAVSVSEVGPTWGGQITRKALRALAIFFVAILIYISLRFEWKMAVAAVVAVIHDILVTVGIYSLTGFQVTPATVVAILTILGYSLYDTIVVFDRVQENTKGLAATGRLSYSDAVNLAMNQTLMRSVNTTAVAVLPVLSVLLIGAGLLGATTLENFGLALTVGLLSGAYSSIFIASPLLAVLKEREPRYRAVRERLLAKGQVGSFLLTPQAAASLDVRGTAGGRGSAGSGQKAAGVLLPGSAAGEPEETGEPLGSGETFVTADGMVATVGAGVASARPGGAQPRRSGGNRPPAKRRGGSGAQRRRKR